VRLLVDKVTLRQILLRVLFFFLLVSIIPSVLRTRLHLHVDLTTNIKWP
jgi:hypothetical protein